MVLMTGFLYKIFRQVAKLAAWWMNASSTTENVRRCALIRMIATIVPVVTAIGWRETNIPAQVS